MESSYTDYHVQFKCNKKETQERRYSMEHNVFSDITPDIVRLADLSRQAGIIEQELFTKYEVKRGLRDLNGKGALAGLTTI